jgi:hypothetical protein
LWGTQELGKKTTNLVSFWPQVVVLKDHQNGWVFPMPFCFHFLLQPIGGSPHFLSGLVALAQLTDYYEESRVNNKEEEEEDEEKL